MIKNNHKTHIGNLINESSKYLLLQQQILNNIVPEQLKVFLIENLFFMRPNKKQWNKQIKYLTQPEKYNP